MTQRVSVIGRSSEVAAAACVATITMSWGWLPSAAASTPSVTITPGAALHDGESITVSVGPNSVFTPHSGIHILECADPGSLPANLPKDDSTCDGNTVQGTSVLVNADGSFSDSGYTVYQVPNAALGEQPNFQPVCNLSNPCVLYLGQDQNDFTAPKVFSAPFTVGPNPSVPSTTTASPGVSISPATPLASSASASTSAPASGSRATANSGNAAGGSLAQTGAPDGLFWMVAVGSLLILGGASGRRAAARSAR